MITVFINGKSSVLPCDCSLAQALAQHNYSSDALYYAVAVNQEFIPRQNHAEYKLQAHDHVDIVTPMQGG